MAQAAARRPRFRRFDVATPQGQRMLQSYARGVAAMLRRPADDPLNWFRNAFVHFLDCPHGNWWFYVWHRGYIGHFERTIRRLSGDPSFALPFWDWTRHPEFPASLCQGVLDPTSAAFAPFTGNLHTFTTFLQPALRRYWNQLSAPQRAQQELRGYGSFEDVWNGVTGWDPQLQTSIAANLSFAVTCAARYPSLANRELDSRTASSVSAAVVGCGLEAPSYYDATVSDSFTSSRTTSHLSQPDGATQFSVLEGLPHNKLHNYIGGVGPIDPGPYGNMTNFLSPVDPVFFLHHANMDRLWDVWTQRQLAQGGPIAPTGDALAPFMAEPFLFFVDAQGRPIRSRAGEVFSTASFDYDYAPGFGSQRPPRPATATPRSRPAAIVATVREGVATLVLPAALLGVAAGESGMAPCLGIVEVTLERPLGLASQRQFDLLLNAPPELQAAEPGSPHYAGTISFFGPPMAHHGPVQGHGSHATGLATFAVPLRLNAAALPSAAAGAGVELRLRLVPTSSPSSRGARPPRLLGLTFRPAQP